MTKMLGKLSPGFEFSLASGVNCSSFRDTGAEELKSHSINLG